MATLPAWARNTIKSSVTAYAGHVESGLAHPGDICQPRPGEICQPLLSLLNSLSPYFWSGLNKERKYQLPEYNICLDTKSNLILPRPGIKQPSVVGVIFFEIKLNFIEKHPTSYILYKCCLALIY